MDICGIDYSTHYVDIVRLGEDHAPTWDRYELVGADSFDRARTVGEKMPGSRFSYWDDVLAVGIEEPAGRNTGHMFRIQGAVLSQIPARMLVEKWMPSQWRKAVGLPGNASKGHVRQHVIGRELDRVKYMGDRGYLYPAWFDAWAVDLSQDGADAYCIALATQKALDKQAVPAQPSDEFGLEEA